MSKNSQRKHERPQWDPTSETTKSEVMMHAVRLMRSECYREAKSLRHRIRQDFPEISEDLMDEYLRELCARMLRNS